MVRSGAQSHSRWLFSEVYTALQLGVVDAEKTPPTDLLQKFFEQQNYIIDTNLRSAELLRHEPYFYNSLPDDLKTVWATDSPPGGPRPSSALHRRHLEMYDKTFTDYGCHHDSVTDECPPRIHAPRPASVTTSPRCFPDVYASFEEAVARVANAAYAAIDIRQVTEQHLALGERFKPVLRVGDIFCAKSDRRAG
jgi:hypothetical protein